MNFKAIIFDKDGVIIDTQPIHFNVLSSFLKDMGLYITEGSNYGITRYL